jgi:hypothetical protein
MSDLAFDARVAKRMVELLGPGFKYTGPDWFWAMTLTHAQACAEENAKLGMTGLGDDGQGR